MSRFLEELAQLKLSIAPIRAAGFRASLLAIARQMQEQPDSTSHSLQAWWQWLDDEGYDREAFGSILGQVCQAKVTEQVYTELAGFIQSIAANPEGIPSLIEYVEINHSALLQELETLESLALEEEQQLQSTAGGMGKAGKYSSGAAGVLLSLVIIKLVHQRFGAEGRARAARIVEKDTKDNLISLVEESTVKRWKAAEKDMNRHLPAVKKDTTNQLLKPAEKSVEHKLALDTRVDKMARELEGSNGGYDYAQEVSRVYRRACEYVDLEQIIKDKLNVELKAIDRNLYIFKARYAEKLATALKDKTLTCLGDEEQKFINNLNLDPRDQFWRVNVRNIEDGLEFDKHFNNDILSRHAKELAVDLNKNVKINLDDLDNLDKSIATKAKTDFEDSIAEFIVENEKYLTAEGNKILKDSKNKLKAAVDREVQQEIQADGRDLFARMEGKVLSDEEALKIKSEFLESEEILKAIRKAENKSKLIERDEDQLENQLERWEDFDTI